MKNVILCFTLIIILYSCAISQNDCSDILKEGPFENIIFKNNSYYQMLLISKLSYMSKKEAEDYLKASGHFPVNGIPVGAEYTDDQYRGWAENVQQEINTNIIISNETNILIKRGDPTIIKAWSDCIKYRNGGVKLILEPLNDSIIHLKIDWSKPKYGIVEKPIIESFFIIGAKYYNIQDSIKKNSTLNTGEKTLILIREENADVDVVLNILYQDQNITYSDFLPVIKSFIFHPPDNAYVVEYFVETPSGIIKSEDIIKNNQSHQITSMDTPAPCSPTKVFLEHTDTDGVRIHWHDAYCNEQYSGSCRNIGDYRTGQNSNGNWHFGVKIIRRTRVD